MTERYMERAVNTHRQKERKKERKEGQWRKSVNKSGRGSGSEAQTVNEKKRVRRGARRDR